MSNERDELAGVISTKLDGIFGTRDFGPATQDFKLADELLAAGYRKPQTIATAEDLDKLPIRTIVAAITHSRNVPIVIVFQRGSIEHGGDGWTTPEAIGQIPSEKVFEFIALNGLPTVFTVLHNPEAQA